MQHRALVKCDSLMQAHAGGCEACVGAVLGGGGGGDAADACSSCCTSWYFTPSFTTDILFHTILLTQVHPAAPLPPSIHPRHHITARQHLVPATSAATAAALRRRSGGGSGANTCDVRAAAARAALPQLQHACQLHVIIIITITIIIIIIIIIIVSSSSVSSQRLRQP